MQGPSRTSWRLRPENAWFAFSGRGFNSRHLHLRGTVELALSSVGSQFPRSVSADESLFEVVELDGLRAVVVVRGDDDLVASLDRVDGGLCELLVERADGSPVLEQSRLDVLGLDRPRPVPASGPPGCSWPGPCWR